MTGRFSNFNSILYTVDRHELRVTGTKCGLPDTMYGTGETSISGAAKVLNATFQRSFVMRIRTLSFLLFGITINGATPYWIYPISDWTNIAYSWTPARVIQNFYLPNLSSFLIFYQRVPEMCNCISSWKIIFCCLWVNFQPHGALVITSRIC